MDFLLPGDHRRNSTEAVPVTTRTAIIPLFDNNLELLSEKCFLAILRKFNSYKEQTDKSVQNEGTTS